MKKDIHPQYHTDATVKCMCGNILTTGSTVKESSVEICSNCHPLYTGEDKVMDMAGRVERFKQRFEKTKELQEKGSKARSAKPQGKQAEEKLVPSEKRGKKTEVKAKKTKVRAAK